MLYNCGVGEDSWESLGLQGVLNETPNESILNEISPEYSLEGLMLKLKLQNFSHLMRRTDSFEKTLMLGRLKAGGEGDNRGWDGWMASPTQWTWFWVNSGSWWWTGLLQSMGLQRVRDDWATELNWCLPVTWALPSSFYLTYFDIFFAIDTFTLKIFNKWLWLWFEHARTYNIHIDICIYIYTMNEIKLTWLGKLN